MIKANTIFLLILFSILQCSHAYDFTFNSQKILLKTLSILVASIVDESKYNLDWKDVMYWSGNPSLHGVRHNLEYLPIAYQHYTT